MSKKFKTPSSTSAGSPACVVAPPVCVVAPACVVSPKREKSSEEKKGLRYFHVSHKKIDDGAYFGRYEGRSPKQAASKAFTALHGIMADKKMPNSGKIHYEFQEITRGSARKVHYYVGERVELETPVIRMIGCKEVPFRFINKIYVDKDAVKHEKPAKPAKKAVKKSKAPKSPKATTSPKKAKPAKSPKATTSPKKAKPAKPAKAIKSPKKTKPLKSPKKTSKVVCKVVKS